jgi:uncharacterized Fe-S radical SAM superfamily protein PflX
VNENTIAFFSLCVISAHYIDAINISKSEIIEDVINTTLINIREDSRDAQARNVSGQGSEVDMSAHF